MIGININVNIKDILNEYMQGISAAAITKKYKIQYNTIKKIVESNGNKMRSQSQANSRYTFNHDFFENIDSEQKAYYLGLILTDGYVGEKDIVIELKSIDRHIIESFVTTISGTNKIHEIIRKSNSFSKKGCITSRLNFRSEKMVNDLGKLGIKKGKTFNINIPKLPDYLERHFWRGVLDGDGYVSCLNRKYKYTTSKGEKKISYNKYLEVGICGHINTVTAFSEFLKKNNIKGSKIFPDHSIFSIRLKNATEANKFLNFIYTNSNPILYLQRKYSKYNEFLEYKKTINKNNISNY